jgi:VanZ family protein
MRVFMQFCSVAAVALLVFAHLGPANWKPRTGLGGQIDHFLGYFAVTSIVCLAWPWPFAVGGALMAASALLEVLQALTPDRTPSLLAALFGASGALTAALLAEFFIRSTVTGS